MTPDDTQIDRYLAGNLEPHEADQIADWLSSSPVRRDVLGVLKLGGSVNDPQFDIAKLEQRIEQHVSSVPRATLAGPMSRPLRMPFRTTIVAMVAIALTCVTGVKLASNINHYYGATQQIRVYKTALTQRVTITLDDGTTAVLAPASIMRVTGRNVELDGQALFTVGSNQSSPFTVRAGKASVRVLGTTFSVRKYSDEVSAKVVVAEGKIAVNNTVVSTGELAVISPHSAPEVRRYGNVSALLTWAQGRLAFEDAPLKEVLIEMRRWYGLDVRVDEELLQDPITVEFATESPSQAVAFLATFLNARVERQGNTVFLTRQHNRKSQ